MHGIEVMESQISSLDTQKCAAVFRNVFGYDFDADTNGSSSIVRSSGASSTQSVTDRDSEYSLNEATNQTRNTSPRTVVVAATTSVTANDSQLLRTGSASASASASATDRILHNQNFSHRQSIADILGDSSPALGNSSICRRIESQEGLARLFPDGSRGTSHLKYVAMEDFVPALGGSDESNLSTTQENDPSVYSRFLEHIAEARLAATQGMGPLRVGATQDNGPTSTGTGISYGVGQTGHITLDYQPPPLFETTSKDSFDNTANGEASSQQTGLELPDVDPQTPAQPKLVLAQPGTVMGLSQMFAATLPSPGSRARQALLPSSSKPSPDMFSHQQLPKDASSSPLVRRAGAMLPMPTADLASSSSPVSWSPAPISNQPRTTQHLPALFDYRSRKESQERRLQHARAVEEEDESSDDGFSDIGAERNRIAKRRKEKAARELAAVGTSRPNSSANNSVEVPSTSNGRRRSLADDYKAQCTGFDARDSQQEDIIADSQSPPHQRDECNLAGESQQDPQNGYLDRKRSGRKDYAQENPTSSGRVVGSEISEQLPGLDQAEDSDASESERETSEPPMEPPANFLLDELSSTIAQLRTPAVQKKVIYSEGDTTVPETSPPEPHIQRYGEIVSQTPPALSAESLGDSYNPFTQDEEFNRLLKSPTPQERMRLTKTKRGKNTPNTALQRPSERCDIVGVVESADSEPVDDAKNSAVAKEAETSSTCLLGTSEYVTAPTSLPDENVRTSNIEEKGQPHAGPLSREAVGRSVIEQVVTQNRVDSPQGARLHIESPDAPLTSDILRDELQITADTGSTDIATPDKIITTPLNAATTTLSKSKLKGRSRPAKRLAAQITDEPVNSSLDELGPRILRPASQVKGSARSLRRSTGNGITMPATTISREGTPLVNSKQPARSSTGAFLLSDELVMGHKPEEQAATVVSARRKSTQIRPAERLLFSGMVFSVSYVSRENEKKNILRLIEQNGGRLLTQGFDELFDMSAIKLASAPRSSEGGDDTGRYGLTLTAEAQTIGFACLLADEHSRRVKYMQALALGLPCMSGRWIEHCVDKGMILGWDSYLLPAGESTFLGGAVRNRNLQPYSAITSKFSESFDQRPQMLTGKAILLVMSKGRAEERKKAYIFLTQALGAKRVKRVHNNAEARKFLVGAEAEGEEWNWVYVDDEKDADKAIFGQPGALKKRKRGSTAHDQTDDKDRAPKKIKIISDEYVIQSLILGKLLEET